MVDDNDYYRDNLLNKLADIAKRGPIQAVTTDDKSVGMTLLNALGIKHTSSSKPSYHGIVVTAHRRMPSKSRNRVNLFAQVPNWSLSSCKSSREIAERYGYDTSLTERRLYCTVNSRNANSQGLILEIDPKKKYLHETAWKNGERKNVATWEIEKLETRLIETHPESFWVVADVIDRGGVEFFHYRGVVYTGKPKLEDFLLLIEIGTITMDHLISIRDGKTNEKGPLFKIKPSNLDMLFTTSKKYDLLTL